MVIDTWENGQYKEIWVYSEETDDDERAMCGLIMVIGVGSIIITRNVTQD